MNIFEIYNEKEVRRTIDFIEALQAVWCELCGLLNHIPREKLLEGFFSFDLYEYEKRAIDISLKDGFVVVSFYDNSMELCKFPLRGELFQAMKEFLKSYFPLLHFSEDLFTVDLERKQVQLSFVTDLEKKTEVENIFEQFSNAIKNLERVHVSDETEVDCGVLFLDYDVPR